MNSSKVLLGILGGVAAGALMGILFAPDSGKETRKKIAKKGTDLGDTVRNKFNELGEVLQEKYESIKKDAATMMENGKAVKEEASKNFS